MTTIGSKYRGTKEFLLVYSMLISAAQMSDIVYYMQVAKIIGIDTPGNYMGREVGQILGEISEDEHINGRPFLSSVAVNSKGVPGPGYFDLGRSLGKLKSTETEDEEKFWKEEKEKVYDVWSPDIHK